MRPLHQRIGDARSIGTIPLPRPSPACASPGHPAPGVQECNQRRYPQKALLPRWRRHELDTGWHRQLQAGTLTQRRRLQPSGGDSADPNHGVRPILSLRLAGRLSAGSAATMLVQGLPSTRRPSLPRHSQAGHVPGPPMPQVSKCKEKRFPQTALHWRRQLQLPASTLAPLHSRRLCLQRRGGTRADPWPTL